MDEITVRSARPDVDIAHDIHDLIVRYPPTASDRQHIEVTVHGGAATLRGHVKSISTRRYLVDRVALIPDIVRVNADDLHTEEDIRLAVGTVVPDGVIVNVRYGTVILNGTPPAGTNVDDLLAKAAGLPGVARVIVAFDNPTS